MAVDFGKFEFVNSRHFSEYDLPLWKQNSWGSSWGKGGYGKISMRYPSSQQGPCDMWKHHGGLFAQVFVYTHSFVFAPWRKLNLGC